MALPSEGKFSSAKVNQPITVDQLLEVARAQGGSIAEVAEELANPRRSIMATMGDGFKKAFGNFVEIVSAPNQIVAGLISQDYTVKEAVEKNIEVSDLVFGAPQKGLTKTQKAASFIGRLAVDVLADPLTYVTFGASRGVLGLKAVQETVAGAGTAQKLGLKNVGDKVAISEEAEELVSRAVTNGEITDDLSIVGEVGGVKITKRDQEILFRKEAVDAQKKGLYTEFIKKKRPEVMDSLEKEGIEVSEKNINERLMKMEDEVAEFISNKTMNERLRPEFAVQAVGNLIEKHPALIETLVEKGGIKFFGESVLSGQRIKSVAKFIPGLSLIDNVTQPIRNRMGALFSRNYTINGRLPDEFIQIDQKYRDLADSMNNEVLTRATNLFRELKITKEEAELITSAIETKIMPRDEKLAAVWQSLNGIEPNPNVIRPEVLRAAGFTKEQLTKNLQLLREAGVPVSNFANYFPHILVKQDVKNIGFRLPPSRTVNAAKFAKISAFEDDFGNRIVGFAEKTGDGLDVTTPEGVQKLKSSDVGQFETETGTSLKRVRASVAEAKALGVDFEDNALSVLLISSLDAIKASVTRDFVRDIGEKMGVRASSAPQTYRAVSVTGLKHEGEDIATMLVDSKGEQLYFHPDVAKRLEEFAGGIANDEATGELMKSYDSLQNYFKATVTSIFPAFHGRNAISNVMLHFLDLGMHSLNPVNHVAAANLIQKEWQFKNLQMAVDAGKKTADEMTEFLSKPMLKDKNGYTWTFGELRKVIKDNVVAFNPRNLGQIDPTMFTRKEIGTMTRALFPTNKSDKFVNVWSSYSPLSTQNKLIKLGFGVGQLVEDQSRLVDFLVNLKKTGDVQLAAQRTKQFLFDYQNLSEFERKYLRRIMPFYTFSRKNIELQVNTLFTSPGRIAGEIRAVQTIGDMLGEGNLSQEEKETLPEWMQDGLNALVKREGSQVTVLSTLGTPIEQIFQQAQANQLLASVSPILKLPVELMSGYSFFHGKMLSDVTNAVAYKSAPQAIKDFIGLTEVQGKNSNGDKYTYYASLRPERMHLLSSLPPTARVLSSLKQMQNQDISDQFKILQTLVGVRPFEFDLEVEAGRREKELRQELERVLDTANVGYTMNRFVLPKEVKQEVGM